MKKDNKLSNVCFDIRCTGRLLHLEPLGVYHCTLKLANLEEIEPDNSR